MKSGSFDSLLSAFSTFAIWDSAASFSAVVFDATQSTGSASRRSRVQASLA
jgi:hypothetical protein